jgi:hypothetical protein
VRVAQDPSTEPGRGCGLLAAIVASSGVDCGCDVALVSIADCGCAVVCESRKRWCGLWIVDVMLAAAGVDDGALRKSQELVWMVDDGCESAGVDDGCDVGFKSRKRRRKECLSMANRKGAVTKPPNRINQTNRRTAAKDRRLGW